MWGGQELAQGRSAVSGQAGLRLGAAAVAAPARGTAAKRLWRAVPAAALPAALRAQPGAPPPAHLGARGWYSPLRP